MIVTLRVTGPGSIPGERKFMPAAYIGFSIVPQLLRMRVGITAGSPTL
jgi:hypothetical protein